MQSQTKSRWEKFFEGLANARDGKIKFTVILNDPLAASYVQNLCAPDADPQLEIVDVERTKEQEEDLGIADMVTEGYEEAQAEYEAAEKEQKAKDAEADKIAEGVEKLEVSEKKEELKEQDE